MSLNKIGIYIERNTKIEYRKYTIYKATLYLKTILLKNVFLKRSVWMAGIAGDLFLKLYLVILVSGKLALRGWFGILETFLQILWSCTLSNSPISNFLDMYLRLKHRSKNCWAIVSSDSEAPYTDKSHSNHTVITQ